MTSSIVGGQLLLALLGSVSAGGSDEGNTSEPVEMFAASVSSGFKTNLSLISCQIANMLTHLTISYMRRVEVATWI